MSSRIRILLLITTTLLLSGCSVGRIVCDFALKPKKYLKSIDEARQIAEERYPGIVDWYDSLRADGVFRDTVITGCNGASIYAVFAGRPDAEGSALIIHGYGSNHIGMLHIAKMYRDSLNFNVILPDLQFHGYSGGDAVQMGWNDRLDARRWIDVANGLWHSDFLLVHGVSMGAATTMMLSGEPDLPENVRCFVEDCGYASVWQQFDNLRQERSPLPVGVLERGSRYCDKRYGWNFHEASSVAQVAECDRPMLFIHGNPDNFVSVDFVYECFVAKTKGYKEIWVEPDTPKHAFMYKEHTHEFMSRVRQFIATIRSL